MASGRRQTILVFCTSPIKELYLSPIEYYDPDMIYVFRNNKDNALAGIENEIYASATIDCNCIKQVETETGDYLSVLAELVDLVRKLKTEFDDCADIFINISAGTHEFAAAAVFVSMMNEKVIAFGVDVKNYGIKECEIRDFVEKLSPAVEEPEMIPTCDYVEPDDELLGFLRVLNEMLATTKYPSHAKIIDELKKVGVWSHNPEKKTNGKRTPIEQKEEMYLKRHYFKSAIANGWIADNTKKITITERGKMLLGVFDRTCYPQKLKCQNNISKKRCFENIQCKYANEELSYDYEMSDINNPFGYDDRMKDSVVSFERKGKKYRFRIRPE